MAAAAHFEIAPPLEQNLGAVNLELSRREHAVQVDHKLFDTTIQRLFQQKGDTGEKGVFVSGYILADGKGDYAHCLRLVDKIRRNCPKRPITVVVIISKKHEGKLTPIKIPNCETFLAYDDRNSEDSDAGPPKEPKRFFSSEQFQRISQLMGEATLWINGPKHIPCLFDRMDKHPDMMRIVEYDRDTNRAAGYKYNANMGLGPDAKGIFIKKAKQYSWLQLENQFLKKTLFQKMGLNEQVVATYLAAATPYMCYIGDLQIAVSFILNVVHFHDATGNQTSIDIIFPSKDRSSQELIKNLKLLPSEELRQLGIASVQVIAYENDHKESAGVKLQEQGKKLRIIDVGYLSKRDFNRIAFLCAPLMGCTGDNSLGQALSFGKIPYYEKRLHKQDLLKNLARLSATCLGADAPLARLHQSLVEHGTLPLSNGSKQNQAIIRSIRLTEDGKKLGAFVRENYSFDTTFTNWVKAILFRQDHPEFVRLEQELRDQYSQGKITLDQAKQLLADQVK